MEVQVLSSALASPVAPAGPFSLDKGDDARRDRPAGRRRLALRHGTEDGIEVGFHGEYLEVVPNERLVHTELWEGLPDDYPKEPAVNTVTFSETDGRTTLSILIEAPSKQVPDLIIESGMEDGLQEALDLLGRAAVSLR